MALTHSYGVRVLLRLVAGLLLGGGLLGQAGAAADPQPAQTRQQAKARFEADKKLCADEASPEARLQCRRDAKAVYDKALAGLKAKSIAPTRPAIACPTCGTVTAIRSVEKPGESNAVGMIAGGVAGAVLGHQVGGGLGKDLATVAGAAGGAYAGKKVQEKMNAKTVWRVSVDFADGSRAEFDFAADPGFKAGDAVKKSGETLVRQ
ncbi:MAG: hypothetical protein Fur007_14830 [Rhodoferax sp.]